MPKYFRNFIILTILVSSTILAACQAADASPPPPLTETPVPTITTPQTTAVAAQTATSPSTSGNQAQDVSAALATPYSDSPAAGICMDAPAGQVISVEIFPDIPSPRCIKVSAGQRVEVINRTDTALQLSLGAIKHSLPPGESYTLNTPLDELLMPGVHVLGASPFSGPEIWLQN